MTHDPVLRFKDCCGNDYVGLDLADAENLAEVLDALLDSLTCLPFCEELTDYLPARRLDHLTDELAAQASFVRHLIAADTHKEER